MTNAEEHPVEISYRPGDPLAMAADALIVPVLAPGGEGGDVAAVNPTLGALDARLDGALGPLLRDARFRGAPGGTLVVPTLGRTPARRIVLSGLGDASDVTAEVVRRAYGSALTAARDAGSEAILAALPVGPQSLPLDPILAAAAEGAELAAYRFDRYRGSVRADGPPPRAVRSLVFAVADEGALGEGAGRAALGRAVAVVRGVSLARDLVNEPGSALNPVEMAARAVAAAEGHGLDATVLDAEELERLGAGAIVAVGRGSATPPRLIHLVYRPAEPAPGLGPIGLVGKCITFDTGGYSIKTYEGMLDMKVDMAGGAAVLGAMTALRALGVRREVHGVICAAENMISGTAFRPGDILTALNGATIEVLSTDAEGRLVLADGLVYAARQGATELIDLATLTGAAVVALGEGTTALFASDDALAERLLAAAGAVGERTWRMPLTEALEDKIRGDVGDLKNTGGRTGGAITAALFLAHFREGLPWAHLDIAGTATTAAAGGYTPKGATGVGVRTLLAYLTDPS
ncbi:MAG: Cytosol aminopeptidase PepA [uncultured Thermomicrobiales bacterium]|uniref:Probable cytosol aminopeptidase n=1 Tax=uncultured Thermomicrobiales bacterium TaxID=1645740 RepID=A0A6J4U3R1_9BACT|nr:MAG: Cytosol aminopeptidase PepA [uncultured Thermomicrobiales bacterium]